MQICCRTLLDHMTSVVFYALKDNIDLFDYNVQVRVNDFVAAALAQVS